MPTNEDILAAIARLGSANAAAKELGISRQAIFRRFARLPDDDPLKQWYVALVGVSRRGPKRVYEDRKARNRRKAKAYRDRQKKQKNLKNGVDKPGNEGLL